MKVRFALFMSALLAVFSIGAASALALPGDHAISASNFRLNDYTLEPGCFIPHRNAPVDVDSHLVFGVDSVTGEAHLTVSDGAAFSIDQVLAPSPIDGYRVVNEFDTGTINNDPDIDPGQTATGITSPTRFVDTRDLIVCVSGGHGDAAQNEPYNQEDGGLVSAKNRPILVPHVTALGVSAIENLNTYKIGFGYSVEQWYSRPSFETSEDGNGLLASVTDPNGFPSPTFGSSLPAFVALAPRPADFPYDARRVNDVDKAGESWTHGDPDDDQSILFKQGGDSTAWTDSHGNGLLTKLTQGDLPISWTLRASLASPDSERTVAFTDDDLRAWNKSWQDYYDCAGPKPTLPLAPGTNSPASDDGNDCNAPVKAPATTSAPASTTSTTTTTIIQQAAGSGTAARSATGAAKKASKASIRSARVVATKQGKRLVVFVKSTKKTARIQIRMYDARGRKVGQMTKTVRTNRSVKVSGVRVAGKVKTVKVTLA
jgi:hypothetical protein